MPTRVLSLIAVLLLALGPGGAQFHAPASNLSTELESKPSPTPTDWPNLDTLKNPNGTTCGLNGAPKGVAERAAQNRLRNRYHLPEKGFEQLTLEDLQKNLPQGEIGPMHTLVNFPTSADSNNERAVTIVAYVTDVLILGCGAADERFIQVPSPKRKGVESAICFVNQEGLCTAQIMVTSDPSLPLNDGHNIFVVSVTRRSRLLAKNNLLVSNIENDWSTETLRKKIKGHWVRFSGWLFFNQNYRDRAWVTDPENKIGKPNDRQTAWEIHPVMGIEVDVPSPQ